MCDICKFYAIQPLYRLRCKILLIKLSTISIYLGEINRKNDIVPLNLVNPLLTIRKNVIYYR